MFFKQPIQLKKRILIIKNKIEDKIKIATNIHNANPKANYLNSIKQNISNDVLKKYVDLYTNLVIKVKDIHHRGCMNNLSSETNTILFYELCKVLQSSFILFCEEDVQDINSYLLKKRCDPNHKQFTDSEQKQITEDKKKLTNKHISFIDIKDIFIAVLLHYCDCNKTERSDKIKYILDYILPEIESDLSIYLHSIISYSEECRRGGKRSDIHKRSKKRSKTQSRRRTQKKKTRKY
jgi:hypothetical protein